MMSPLCGPFPYFLSQFLADPFAFRRVGWCFAISDDFGGETTNPIRSTPELSSSFEGARHFSRSTRQVWLGDVVGVSTASIRACLGLGPVALADYETCLMAAMKKVESRHGTHHSLVEFGSSRAGKRW